MYLLHSVILFLIFFDPVFQLDCQSESSKETQEWKFKI